MKIHKLCKNILIGVFVGFVDLSSIGPALAYEYTMGIQKQIYQKDKAMSTTHELYQLELSDHALAQIDHGAPVVCSYTVNGFNQEKQKFKKEKYYFSIMKNDGDQGFKLSASGLLYFLDGKKITSSGQSYVEKLGLGNVSCFLEDGLKEITAFIAASDTSAKLFYTQGAQKGPVKLRLGQRQGPIMCTID